MTPDEIRALRERLGLSQQGLADRIREVDPLLRPDRNIVSRWERSRERGGNAPNPHYLAALKRIEVNDEPSAN